MISMHMTNKKDSAFLQDYLKELAVVNKAMKDFLFNEGHRNVRAMGSWVSSRSLEPKMIWGEDPVHVQSHFKHLVEGVKITLENIGGKKRTTSLVQTESKRGWLDMRGGQTHNTASRNGGGVGDRRSPRQRF
jgi:hypothetical protein